MSPGGMAALIIFVVLIFTGLGVGGYFAYQHFNVTIKKRQ